MKKFSIIIPAYNEEKNIQVLLKSIESIDYPRDFFEIIVVDDASTDTTVSMAKLFPNIKIITHSKNQGRYITRKTGADKANSEHLLFLDARTIPDNNILKALNTIDNKVIIGYSLGQKKETVFEIMYTAFREKIFKKFYEKWGEDIVITPENFDDYPKGTTVLYIQQELLQNVYKKTESATFNHDSSDDIKFLRAIVLESSILISPQVQVVNYGRQDFIHNIVHLYRRGAKFFDYYGNPKQKKFWTILILPFMIFIGMICLIMYYADDSAEKVGWGLLLSWAGVSLFFSGIHTRFFSIFLLIPIATITFFLGILRGILLALRK